MNERIDKIDIQLKVKFVKVELIVSELLVFSNGK